MTSSAATNAPLTVLAIDPGSQKCGIAVVRFDPPTRFQTLHREIAPTAGVAERTQYLTDAHPIALILLGDATGGKALYAVLRPLLPESLSLKVVPERYTTQRASARYFRENERLTPRFFLHLLGLALPPRPIDDYAAVLIAEDYLRGSRQ